MGWLVISPHNSCQSSDNHQWKHSFKREKKKEKREKKEKKQREKHREKTRKKEREKWGKKREREEKRQIEIMNSISSLIKLSRNEIQQLNNYKKLCLNVIKKIYIYTL